MLLLHGYNNIDPHAIDSGCCHRNGESEQMVYWVSADGRGWEHIYTRVAEEG